MTTPQFLFVEKQDRVIGIIFEFMLLDILDLRIKVCPDMQLQNGDTCFLAYLRRNKYRNIGSRDKS